ncbi:MAG: hypothetical protein A2Y55_11475 [Actinobacteria bacterium RBG_16_68_12]|nr:MAG: hypothetical protein A2Y55_11475 [Actinobacteria bacterium RBG_16_68_12]
MSDVLNALIAENRRLRAAEERLRALEASRWVRLNPRRFWRRYLRVPHSLRWAELGEDPLLRPGPAVDAFLTVIGGKYELLFAGYQLGVRKVSVTW